MDRLRIAFFSHDAELYGASRSLVSLVKGLEDRGVQCLIIVPYRGPLVGYLKENKLKFYLITYPSWFYRPKDVIKNGRLKLIFKFVFKMCRVLFDRQLSTVLKPYNLFVTNTSTIPIGALLSMKLGRTHIWYIRELVELHYGFKYILGKRFFLYLISQSKLRLFNSGFVMNYYKNLLPSGNINRVIYNGIYTKEKFVECYGRNNLNRKQNDGTFVFCLIGYIHPGKGQEQAVDAMVNVVSEFKNAKLLIAGDGATTGLQKYVDDKNIQSNVTLVGFVDDVSKIFLQSDGLLNCAKFEAFGRTTVEAMAFGLPVIGNNMAGTAEIIQHEFSGLLYNGTTEELAMYMKKLIQDPDYARKLGHNGWQLASEKYTVERYVEEFYNFTTQHLAMD